MTTREPTSCHANSQPHTYPPGVSAWWRLAALGLAAVALAALAVAGAVVASAGLADSVRSRLSGAHQAQAEAAATPKPLTPSQPDQLSARDVTPLNIQIGVARSIGETWVNDPMQVVLHCVVPDTAAPESWEFGERHISLKYEKQQLRVTIETTGFWDDSVAADKQVVVLSQDAGGDWSLNSLSFGERCWPGRGHTNYSTGPCL